MIFWLLIGILTALATAYLVSPLVRWHRRLAGMLILVLPLAALALYCWLGHPELIDMTAAQ